MNGLCSLELSVRLPLDRFVLEVELTANSRVTGLFGPSGSGKTSLLETVAGLRRRAQGRIALGGEVWLDSERRVRLPPERRQVGLVPQDALLFPHLDVRRNLLAGARRALRNGDPAGVEQVFEVVNRVLELGPILARGVSTLSGGERQRVALGRALCSGARLLLLDEPLAGLDVPLQRRILPFLSRVRDEFPVPMLLVSHDTATVMALCDDLIVLQDGKVKARGEPWKVLSDPAVFPLAREEGFQNVLPCIVLEAEDSTCTVRLGRGGEGPLLVAMRGAARSGEGGLVGIPAEDVILAVEEPRGLSARNVLPAAVTSVTEVGTMRLVRASLGPVVPELVVEVTAAACRELSLVPGRRVYLIIKSAACRLFGG